MFRKVISRSPLVGQGADEVFKNITASNWNNDVSFEATLRALLASRIPEGESIYTVCGRTTFSVSNINHADKEVATRALGGRIVDSMDDGGIYIHHFEGAKNEDNDVSFAIVNENFTTQYPEFTKLEKVTEFYKSVMDVLCFVNIQHKKTVIYVNRLTVPRYHYLQCGILAYLPWYFDKEKGVTKQEMELIESLRKNKADDYERIIEEIASKYDFRSEAIKRGLRGFETRLDEKKAEELRSIIKDAVEEINNYSEAIGKLLAKNNERECTLLGLEQKIIENRENGGEMMDYFLANKRLNLVSVNDDTIRFTVKDYLTYWDRDMAEEIISNRRSYVYYPGGNDMSSNIPADDIEVLMRSIFVDEKLKIKFCSAYDLQLYGRVRGIGGFQYDYNCSDAMANPHIDFYECLGNYTQVFAELLKDRDYIGAIEQCIASCKSLNFGDSIVMSRFMEVLYGLQSEKNNRCIELPNGTVVDPKRAIVWLTADKNGEEVKNG